MPARADVNYSSVPSVAPEATGGGQPFRVQASPADFGAQVGGALREASGQLGEAGDQAFNYEMKQQGLLNEAAATDGGTQHAGATDDIVTKFKSLEGFAASPDSPAYGKAVADIKAQRQQIAATMRSPNAARAFNTLAMRSETYALRDVAQYAASQVKVASNNSAKASLDLSVSQASKFDTAIDDARFDDIGKEVDFSLGIMLPNQGYGPDGGTGMKVDADTGKITFNDTDKGRAAEAVYENTRNKAIGQAWENRIEAVSNDPTNGNALRANEIYQAHKADIPPEAQVKISGFLQAKVRNAQTRQSADQFTSNLDNDYYGAVTGSGPSNPNNLGNVKTAFGGFAAPATAADGALLTANTLRSGYQGMTLAEIGKKWTGEGPDKVADWVKNASTASGISADAVPDLSDPKVLHSLVKGISVAEKSPEDRQAFTDDVIDQGVQGSLAGKKAGLIAGNQTIPTPPNNVSKADYYRQNFSTIMGRAQKQGDDLFPDDPVAASQFVSRVNTSLQHQITQQEMSYTADVHLVQGALVKPMADGTLPTSVEQMPPEAQAAYTRTQINNPQAALGVDRVMAANAKGQAAGYGSQFYSYLQKALAPNSDPNRIVDTNSLSKNALVGGEDGPLTNTGLRELQNIIGQRGTPEGDAAAAQMLAFLHTAHNMISGQTASIADPKGEQKYAEFLKHAIPQIVAAQRSGSVAKLYDQKGDLYNSITNFMRPTRTQTSDYIYRTDVRPADAWEGSLERLDLNNPTVRSSAAQSLKDLYKTNRITLQQAKTLAVKHGFATTDAPHVPLPQ